MIFPTMKEVIDFYTKMFDVSLTTAKVIFEKTVESFIPKK